MAHDSVDGIDGLAGAEPALETCDAYIVLVSDEVSAEVDAYGPLPGMGALVEAERLRAAMDRRDLTDVLIRVVRLNHAL